MRDGPAESATRLMWHIRSGTAPPALASVLANFLANPPAKVELMAPARKIARFYLLKSSSD